jgi:hypothetical protein
MNGIVKNHKHSDLNTDGQGNGNGPPTQGEQQQGQCVSQQGHAQLHKSHPIVSLCEFLQMMLEFLAQMVVRPNRFPRACVHQKLLENCIDLDPINRAD